MSLLIKGVNKLSELDIDAILNMAGFKIENLGAPDSNDDAKRNDSAPAAHNQATGTITSGQFPLSRMPRAVSGQFIEGTGAGSDPVYNALIAANIPNLAASKITSGRFPVARLPAVTNEKILKGTGGDLEEVDLPNSATENWLHSELVEDAVVEAARATVGDFQANPGTGTAANPQRLNDNSTTNEPSFTVIGHYVEVDFQKPVIIRRWRYFGKTTHTGDGVSKIQYWDLISNAWVDWVTGIPTRVVETWSGFTTETAQITTKIRVIATAIDTWAGVRSEDQEWEVIY